MAKDTPFDRARDFVEETKEVLGDSYSRARDQFDDLSGDALKNMSKTAKRLEKKYGYVWDDTRKYVRDNPGTALAISLGLGFLLGFLFRGDSD